MEKAITNYHERQFIYGYDVPDNIIVDNFDHLTDDELSDHFLKYKGIYYHISDFMRSDDSKWHGVCGLTNTAAIGIHVSDDTETYQIALLV